MNKPSKPLSSRLTLVILAMIFSFGCQTKPSLEWQDQRNTFAPGEVMIIKYKTPKNYAKKAWVGIIPAHIPHGSESTNDEHDLIFKYLEGNPEGTLHFVVPNLTGKFDFRMHDNDSSGKEVASLSFTIDSKNNQSPVALSIVGEKTEFAPGEEIALKFKSHASYPRRAWVGIIPSDVAHGQEDVNDSKDIAYRYLEKKTEGTLTFKAPDQAGQFDFRMHDSDNQGVEVASVSFSVKAPK